MGRLTSFLLRAAKRYLQLGFHPIPCRPRAKVPLVSWKAFQETAPSEGLLESWWGGEPEANVALVLGRGVFALDFDGGSAAEELFRQAGFVLPSCPINRTPNGFHALLRSDRPISDRIGWLSTNGGKPQVDVRGVGIIVVPPSVHPCGKRYEWTVKPYDIPQAPGEIVDSILKCQARVEVVSPKDPGWILKALDGVRGGARDATAASLAGYFLGKGIPGDIVGKILEGYAGRCDPPFQDRPVMEIVESIAKYHPGQDRQAKVMKLSEILLEVVKEADRPRASAVKSGFSGLDDLIDGGFEPGELVYMGARPGVGKTSIGLQMAVSAAKAGRKVLFVSREMVNRILARRIVSQELGIPASSLKHIRDFTDMQLRSLVSGCERLSDLTVWMCDEVSGVVQLRDVMEVLCQDPGIDFLIVDYLQLVRAKPEIQDRRLQVEFVSSTMKEIAVRHKIPVICMSSLSRPLADKPDAKPTMSSLRDSGELEHDADIVIFLHRKFEDDDLEMIVSKNRNGRVGTIRLKFRSEFVSFEAADAKRRGPKLLSSREDLGYSLVR